MHIDIATTRRRPHRMASHLIRSLRRAVARVMEEPSLAWLPPVSHYPY